MPRWQFHTVPLTITTYESEPTMPQAPDPYGRTVIPSTTPTMPPGPCVVVEPTVDRPDVCTTATTTQTGTLPRTGGAFTEPLLGVAGFLITLGVVAFLIRWMLDKLGEHTYLKAMARAEAMHQAETDRLNRGGKSMLYDQDAEADKDRPA